MVRQICLLIRFNCQRCVVLRRGQIGPARSRGAAAERRLWVGAHVCSHDTTLCGLRQLHVLRGVLSIRVCARALTRPGIPR
eukprot:1209111-Prymnesium_polylepis.1